MGPHAKSCNILQNLPKFCKNVLVASDFYEIVQILSIYMQQTVVSVVTYRRGVDLLQ